MRASFLTAICLLLACMAGCVAVSYRHTTTQGVKGIEIFSGDLCVAYNVSDGTFSARRGEKVFVKNARFTEAVGDDIPKARAARIQDTLGSAQAIEVKFPSGYV